VKEESIIQQEIQIKARFFECMLMRNNSGAFTDNTGRLVRYGLGNISKKHNDSIKSSDLIGFTKVIVTQDMVGKTLAVFTAIEVKKEDWKYNKNNFSNRENAQYNFINWVTNNGGLAGFCNDAEQVKEILSIR